MKKFLLPEEGQFYKANLHCHSTVSDGDYTPEELKRDYMAQGYSIIAFTDHDLMVPHPELADENFLPLNGYELEINDPPPGGSRWQKSTHICMVALEPDNRLQVCWHRSKYLLGNAPQYAHLAQFDENEPDFEREYTPECISEMIRRGRENGFFVTYNHPGWSLDEYEHYIGLNGMNAMEIMNFACYVDGHNDYNPRVYDDMLKAGKRIYCIAADDTHRPHHRFGGFTMIKAPKLEYRAVTKALENGHFYASQGPEIHALWLEDDELHITCSPAARITLNSACRHASARYPKEGELLTETVFPVSKDHGYFRVTVTDATGKHANTSAYFADEWL